MIETVALDSMKAEATGSLPRESGGILIGRFEEDRVIITHAGGPGRRASRTRGAFQRDGEHAQRLLDAAVSTTGGRVDYVGEWHSHPADSPASLKDTRSMERVSDDPEYKRSRPILVVVRRVGGAWKIDASQFADGRLNRLPIENAAVAREGDDFAAANQSP